MWNKVKKHLLTGISYMIPLVAAGGLLQAIAKIFGGALVGEAVGTVPYMINSMGSAAMSLDCSSNLCICGLFDCRPCSNCSRIDFRTCLCRD